LTTTDSTRAEWVGRSYDETRRADPEIARRLAEYLQLSRDGAYLDVACGTGNYTTALSERGGSWYGVDPQPKMLREACRKSSQVCWSLGNVRSLGFPDATFSGVLCTLAIHYFPDLKAAFGEVRRVLRDGPFVIFTAGRDQTRGYWLHEYFPVAMERSIEQLPPLDHVTASLREVGFREVRIEPYEVTPDLQDLFLYSGKHRPELYLSERVRGGIGTFANLADPEEVEVGLERLRSDIESGRIRSVMDRYANAGGDYAFVVSRAS
jgi:SAM-dependent methyltransferase